VTSPALIVSIHDITTSTLDLVRRQVKELSGLGVARASLLAVPHYHGEERLDQDAILCDWLRKCQADGHEIVLHGWTHQGSRPGKSGAWFYERLYTAGEAEFLTLDGAEARERIEKGRTMLRALGFQVSGFIAPAWLMNSEVERAARDAGFLYTNTISEMVHLPNGRRFPARSCVWSVRARWRRACSLAWNDWLFRRLQGADLLRISLHPRDLDYPGVWAQIRRTIRLARQQRACATYSEWIQRRCASNRSDETRSSPV
jgi:predicted deacetylase